MRFFKKFWKFVRKIYNFQKNRPCMQALFSKQHNFYTIYIHIYIYNNVYINLENTENTMHVGSGEHFSSSIVKVLPYNFIYITYILYIMFVYIFYSHIVGYRMLFVDRYYVQSCIWNKKKALLKKSLLHLYLSICMYHNNHT